MIIKLKNFSKFAFVCGLLLPFFVFAENDSAKQCSKLMKDSELFLEVDKIKALESCSDAVKKNPNDLTLLLYLADANTANKNYEVALAQYKVLADKGNISAMMDVGDFYLLAWGTKRSEYLAEVYWTKAATQGDVEVKYTLGWLYLTSFMGFTQSIPKAIKWLEIAAEENYIPAMVKLGYVYSKRSDPIQPKLAFYWLDKAAKLNDAEAQEKLGDFYANGVGVEKSFTKAITFWKKSAENGNGMALFKMGKLHYEGKKLKQSYKKAFEYFSRSDIAMTYSPAQLYLGKMYLKGQGTKKDVELAYMYLLTHHKNRYVIL